MSDFQPEYLILHDYGGKPSSFNPYHALVSGGQVRYRYPENPYGQPAPHAFRLNPKSIGLSWGGAVGGTPDQADLDALRREVAAIKQRFPNIKIMSHGEAYQATRGTGQQASRDGRGLEEAAWRRFLDGTGPMPQQAQTAASGPPPVSARAITAGHPASVANNPAPMPFSLAAPAMGADPNATPAAAPAEVAGIKLPFGLTLGKSSQPQQDDPMMEAPQLVGRGRRPLDMTQLMQLASIKRGGGIG